MENLIKIDNKEMLVVDSREVAEMLGKEHSELLKEIEGRKDNKNVGIIPTLEKGNFHLSNYFIPSTYRAGTREYKCYLVTKMGCELLGNKQQGEKGILFTAKYVERFNQMEQALREQEKPKLPATYKEALLELVKTIEEKERVEEEKQRLIHNNKTYTATEMAKELGFRSAVAFNKYLAEKKIQYKVNNTWVLSARYSECGYQSIKQIELDTGMIVYDRRWTGLGRDWLVNEVMKEDKTVA